MLTIKYSEKKYRRRRRIRRTVRSKQMKKYTRRSKMSRRKRPKSKRNKRSKRYRKNIKGGGEFINLFRGAEDKFYNLGESIKGVPHGFSSYPWDQPISH